MVFMIAKPLKSKEKLLRSQIAIVIARGKTLLQTLKKGSQALDVDVLTARREGQVEKRLLQKGHYCIHRQRTLAVIRKINSILPFEGL